MVKSAYVCSYILLSNVSDLVMGLGIKKIHTLKSAFVIKNKKGGSGPGVVFISRRRLNYGF